MQIEVVTDETHWQKLEGAWRGLLSHSDADTPFLQWEWVTAWWKHYGAGHELAVLTARGHDGVVGIAPLFIEHRAGPLGARVIHFLGTGEAFSEYLTFIIQRGHETQATRAFLGFLFDEWRNHWDVLQLSDVPSNSVVVLALQDYFVQHAVRYRRTHSSTCWRIELAENWEQFLKGQSRNRREKLRRYLRDLSKHGLEFHEVTKLDEIESAWGALAALHQLRWAHSGEAGCFASARFGAFHSDLLQPLFDRGMLSLSLLRSGNRPVAASYCLRHRGVVYFYQGGVDPDWWHCRPGHILRTCELRRAIERGDRVYDLLGGDMDYKSQWATPSVTTLEIVASAPGRWAELQFGITVAGRWLKHRVRAHLSSATWSRLRRWKQRRELVAAGVPAQLDRPRNAPPHAAAVAEEVASI